MSDKIFAKGMVVKERHPKTPDYVICNLSVKVDEFIQTLQENQSNGWVNIKCQVAKSGKPYAEIDTWQPTQGDAAKAGLAQVSAAISAPAMSFDDLEDIPF